MALEAADAATGAAPEPVEAPPARPARALWFADGLGRDAILARERGDHAAARVGLESMLAQGGLGVDDRAAAELLLGLEELRAGAHAAAADRFAAARPAAGLKAIELRIRLLEAQARLDAGQPAPALALVVDLDPRTLDDSPLRGDLLVIQADAALRTDDVTKARASYRRYLAEHGDGERRHEVSMKLARSLAKSDDAAEQLEAAAAFEALLVAVPLSDFAEEAERELARLRAAGLGKRGAALREFERQIALGRIDAMIDRGRYRQAVRGPSAASCTTSAVTPGSARSTSAARTAWR